MEGVVHINIAEPPEFLYKAVDFEFIDLIYANGLTRLKTPFIDLYETEAKAKSGFKKRKPSYVFTIRSAEMQKDGYDFIKLENGIWGTDIIPHKYILLNG